MRFTNLLSLLLVMTLSGGPVFAAGADFAQKKARVKKRSLTVDDNPLPRGSGKIAGGIVTASVGSGLGLLVIFSLMFSSCGADDGTSDYDSCKADQQNRSYLAGGLIVGGIAIGVPLIVIGAKERRAWKQWNRDNVKGYTLLEPDADFQNARDAARFARANSAKRGPALTLISYEF